MKHVGIIAEYNPFHNGHAYQLKAVRSLFPDRKILIVMSGDFVQRGEPAIFNKYIRTKCALSCGADLLFELPPLFAASSAEYFATAAVLALSATGVVDTLCFGAETEDITALQQIAQLFVEEPKAYRQQLRAYLKSGLSFPEARSRAAAAYFQNNSYQALLLQPNNILGIEYLKAISKYRLDLTPVIIKRQGSPYHDLSLERPFSSASALRQAIRDKFQNRTDCPDPVSALKDFLPEPAYLTLTGCTDAKPLFLSDFYPFLQYALWNQKHPLDSYLDVSADIASQLSSFRPYPLPVDTLLDQLCSKNYTRTRIQRALLHILLDNRTEDMDQSRQTGCLSYLRLLGFDSEAAFVLKEMKKTCTVPVINKVADAKKILSGEALLRFEKDLHTSTLYKQAFFNKYRISMPSEYEQSVIIQKKHHTMKEKA